MGGKVRKVQIGAKVVGSRARQNGSPMGSKGVWDGSKKVVSQKQEKYQGAACGKEQDKGGMAASNNQNGSLQAQQAKVIGKLSNSEVNKKNAQKLSELSNQIQKTNISNSKPLQKKTNHRKPVYTSFYQPTIIIPAPQIQCLKEIQIETCDAKNGRPSLVDIDNRQVQLGKPLFDQAQKPPKLPAPSNFGQVSKKGVNGPSIQSRHLGNDIGTEYTVPILDSTIPTYLTLSSVSSISPLTPPPALKFKKKSQMVQKENFQKMLENKSRISINSRTGQQQILFGSSKAGIRNQNKEYFENGFGVDNLQSICSHIGANNANALQFQCKDNMKGADHQNDVAPKPNEIFTPIHPTGVLWQMPYDDRVSYLSQQCEIQLNRMSKMNCHQCCQLWGSSANYGDVGTVQQPKQSRQVPEISKIVDSCEFVKASGSDSEFEVIDDYVDVEEEGNIRSKVQQIGDGILSYNMVLAEKYRQSNPSIFIDRVSLLSRASTHIKQNTKKIQNERISQISKQNYDRSSQLLNSIINEKNLKYFGQNTQDNRDSVPAVMSGIDELEEFDQRGQTDTSQLQTPMRTTPIQKLDLSINKGKDDNILVQNSSPRKAYQSSRGSTLQNMYNFPAFFTPSKESKRKAQLMEASFEQNVYGSKSYQKPGESQSQRAKWSEGAAQKKKQSSGDGEEVNDLYGLRNRYPGGQVEQSLCSFKQYNYSNQSAQSGSNTKQINYFCSALYKAKQDGKSGSVKSEWEVADHSSQQVILNNNELTFNGNNKESAYDTQELGEREAPDDINTGSSIKQIQTTIINQNFISGKFSQQTSMMNDTYQDEPEDPDTARMSVDNQDTFLKDLGLQLQQTSHQGSSPDKDRKIFGRNSKPCAQLHYKTHLGQDSTEKGRTIDGKGGMSATPNPQQAPCITQIDDGEDDAFKRSGLAPGGDRKMIMKQCYSQALSAKYAHNYYKSTQDNMEEQTEERFVVESAIGGGGPGCTSALTNSYVDMQLKKEKIAEDKDHVKDQDNDYIELAFPLNPANLKALNSQEHTQSLKVIEQDSDDFEEQHAVRYHNARLRDQNYDPIDSSIKYCEKDEIVMNQLKSFQSSEYPENLGSLIHNNLGSSQEQNVQSSNEQAESAKKTDSKIFMSPSETLISQLNPSHVQNQMQASDMMLKASDLSSAGLANSNLPKFEQDSTLPQTIHISSTEKNSSCILSQLTTKVARKKPEKVSPRSQDQSSHIYVDSQKIDDNEDFSASDKDSNDQSSGNENLTPQQSLHKEHFVTIVESLQYIKEKFQMVSEEDIKNFLIELPQPRDPSTQKKLAIFDMDETLIHCVDDIETQDPDIVLEIDFPDEQETVYAGINMRPYVMECLQEANKHYQVVAFTASHQTYADAILDFLDPHNELIHQRLYRQHCLLTQEGYYVKDLRIFKGWELKDIVIIDNSAYSFAFQIDNGIPIIPFYDDKNDEEMLHLMSYLESLANSEDIRLQNRQAFELHRLAQGQGLGQAQADPVDSHFIPEGDPNFEGLEELDDEPDNYLESESARQSDDEYEGDADVIEEEEEGDDQSGH